MPILFAYIYKTRVRKEGGKNDLKHWIFENKDGKEVRHQVSGFKAVGNK